MKTTFAAASILALCATGAIASDTASVTLTVTVGEYIEITEANDSALTVADAFGGSGVSGNNNRNAAFSDKSLFLVSSNVDFDVELAWSTWTPAGPGTYNQAAYDNGDCLIGGTITADTNPAPNSVNTGTSPGGASPWMLSSNSAFPASAFSAGEDRPFAIGIEASPDVTDCPGGVAAPGDYTLEVDITVAAS